MVKDCKRKVLDGVFFPFLYSVVFWGTFKALAVDILLDYNAADIVFAGVVDKFTDTLYDRLEFLWYYYFSEDT